MLSDDMLTTIASNNVTDDVWCGSCFGRKLRVMTCEYAVCAVVCVRVWVRNVAGKTALVRYIDYGNEDNVARDALCELPAECWQHQPVALPCRALSFAPGQSLIVLTQCLQF